MGDPHEQEWEKSWPKRLRIGTYGAGLLCWPKYDAVWAQSPSGKNIKELLELRVFLGEKPHSIEAAENIQTRDAVSIYI